MSFISIIGHPECIYERIYFCFKQNKVNITIQFWLFKVEIIYFCFYVHFQPNTVVGAIILAALALKQHHHAKATSCGQCVSI